MSLVNIMEWDAGAEHGWVSQGVVAHAKAEDGASHGRDSRLASKPRTTSTTHHIRRPMSRVD
jgi:hypothetical protein